jgi:hypothetical protein
MDCFYAMGIVSMTDCVYAPVETIADQIGIYLDEYIT